MSHDLRWGRADEYLICRLGQTRFHFRGFAHDSARLLLPVRAASERDRNLPVHCHGPIPKPGVGVRDRLLAAASSPGDCLCYRA